MARSICRRAAWRCRPSISRVAARARRWARLVIATTMSRSRRSSLAGVAAGGDGSDWRLAFRNSSGCSSKRCRSTGPPPFHAAYSSPACRVLKRCRAKASAMRWQSVRLTSAIGARNFVATWAEILPSRTCCWTPCGSRSTKASRRVTQPTLRLNWRASSSSPYPQCCSSSASSQPSSRAVRCGLIWIERSSTSASAAAIGQTTASTMSRPSCSSAAMRL